MSEQGSAPPSGPMQRLLPGSRMALARPSRRFAAVSLAGQPKAKGDAPPVDRTVAKKPASDVLAGAVARAASQGTIHPLDTLKVRMQTGKGFAPPGISKIGQLLPPSGAHARVASALCAVRSLYTGVAGAASGAGIALGAYFACYGAATNALLAWTEMPATSVAFAAGGLAAAGSSVVKVPLAVCIRSVQAGIYPNALAAGRSIVATTGPRGLFTGFTPTLLEDVPDMAVKFAAYESLRQLHSRWSNGRKASPGEDFAMGAFAGAVAAAATTPLDVIKTNMMCNAGARPTMLSAAREVHAQGGVAAFARGIGPRALSNGINSAVFFCFFEAIRSHFAKQVRHCSWSGHISQGGIKICLGSD